jgi:hypothetical protein
MVQVVEYLACKCEATFKPQYHKKKRNKHSEWLSRILEINILNKGNQVIYLGIQ